MPHNRSPKPGARYYLPSAEYTATVKFCLCYRDWKTRLNDLELALTSESYPLRAYYMDGMPHGSATSDPTAVEALNRDLARARITAERDRLRQRVKLIEDTVKQTCGAVLYPYILEGVTSEGSTFARLVARGMPLNKNAYTVTRRKVYFHIARAL